MGDGWTWVEDESGLGVWRQGWAGLSLRIELVCRCRNCCMAIEIWFKYWSRMGILSFLFLFLCFCA